jgi:hypothetical protein
MDQRPVDHGRTGQEQKAHPGSRFPNTLMAQEIAHKGGQMKTKGQYWKEGKG